MPKHPKRPRDMNELAKFIGDVATGEATDEKKEPLPDKQAVRRGKARANELTPARRAEIARKAAQARWGKRNGRI